MSCSSYKDKKQIKIVITVILISLWVTSIFSGRAVLTADWGDVVDVHYLRFENPDYSGQPVEDDSLPFIYLSTGQTVPSEILALYPEALATYFLEFKAGIIGLSVDEEKYFTANQQGSNYYFRVTLLKIWFDAVPGQTASTTTTTSNNQNTPLEEIDSILILGGGAAIIISGLLFWASTTQKRRQQALGQDSTSSSRRERSIKQKKAQLKELRELVEKRETTDKSQEPTQPDVKFRRRR